MVNDDFPRELKPFERELLEWVLPDERPGYVEYRKLLGGWRVVAQGRRGKGNYLVAPLDERPDNESPLPSVIAYGIVETSEGEISVSVRERLGNQVEFEIAKLGKGDDVVLERERRRWTLSSWLPGSPCPQCASAPREISMQTTSARRLALAICPTDRRIWIYDEETGINHPVPITNFYNELMFHKKVRDPEIALNSRRLFEKLHEFSDSDLVSAFRSYNQVRTKVDLEEPIVAPAGRKQSLFRRLVSYIANKPSQGQP